jgi:hypothetical protein
MGWVPSFDFEGRLYGRYILTNKPNAKIAVLYLNDDLGKEYLRGFKEGRGALLDDLVKDRKEADSKLKRDTVWDWYKTAMRTRLRKDGWNRVGHRRATEGGFAFQSKPRSILSSKGRTWA